LYRSEPGKLALVREGVSDPNKMAADKIRAELVRLASRHERDGKSIIESMEPYVSKFQAKGRHDTRDLGYVGPERELRKRAEDEFLKERGVIIDNHIADTGMDDPRDEDEELSSLYRCGVAAGMIIGTNDEQAHAMAQLAKMAGYSSRIAELHASRKDGSVVVEHCVAVVAKREEELKGLPDLKSTADKGLVVIDPRLQLMCPLSDYVEKATKATNALKEADIGVRAMWGKKFIDISLLTKRIESFRDRPLLRDVERLGRREEEALAKNYGFTLQPRTHHNNERDLDGPAR
jgi:hypothetical protein